MKTPAIYTLASADLMSAFIADWGRGQLTLPVKNKLGARDFPPLVLVGDVADPTGVEWAATLLSVGPDGRTVTVGDAMALYKPIRELWAPDGRTFENVSGIPAGSSVLCNAKRLTNEMAARRPLLDSLIVVHEATSEDWKQALLKAGDKITGRQRAMLVAHAQAPGLVADMETLALAAGVSSLKAGQRECDQAGGTLAAALGAMHLPDDWLALVSDDEVQQVQPYPDEPGWRTRLRWPLAQAMLDLGWVAEIGSPEFTPPLAGAQTSSVLIAAATREVDADPRTRAEGPTQREALVLARLGQGKYRERMLRLWGSRCALTGASVVPVLVASHALAWAESDNDQRLDPYNGLLLAASVDRLFDAGLISFSDEGALLKAATLHDDDLELLGIKPAACLRFVAPQHLPYLLGHRRQFGFEMAEVRRGA